jgi:peptidoglycan/LPS O-acetylase OafA/YrhL
VKEEWLALGYLGGVLHNLIYFYLGIELVRLGLTSVSRSIWTLAILTGFYVLQGYLHSIEIATFIFTLIGISGCLVCGHFLSGSNLLSSLGRYSYQIYLFSWFFQIPARIVFGQIWCPSIWLAVTASLGAGILGPIVLTRFLEKVAPKWLSTLYGT